MRTCLFSFDILLLLLEDMRWNDFIVLNTKRCHPRLCLHHRIRVALTMFDVVPSKLLPLKYINFGMQSPYALMHDNTDKCSYSSCMMVWTWRTPLDAKTHALPFFLDGLQIHQHFKAKLEGNCALCTCHQDCHKVRAHSLEMGHVPTLSLFLGRASMQGLDAKSWNHLIQDCPSNPLAHGVTLFWVILATLSWSCGNVKEYLILCLSFFYHKINNLLLLPCGEHALLPPLPTCSETIRIISQCAK